jgi:AhpD family alkylhydroperoxidase
MSGFYEKETIRNLRRLRQLKPELFRSFTEFSKLVFSDSALPAKMKELMAITAAHVTQCPWCIDEHVKRAKARGASDEEIAEAVYVAMAMRAGGAWSHGAIAMASAEGEDSQAHPQTAEQNRR